jgi:geranylgeranyl pyrophosphate synthase
MNSDELQLRNAFLEEENKKLAEENARLQNELEKTKEHLKKYTAPANMKKYYENHKEEIKQRVKDYKERTNYLYQPSPEQKKAWARTAYLNKKEKQKKTLSSEEI